MRFPTGEQRKESNYIQGRKEEKQTQKEGKEKRERYGGMPLSSRAKKRERVTKSKMSRRQKRNLGKGGIRELS